MCAAETPVRFRPAQLVTTLPPSLPQSRVRCVAIAQLQSSFPDDSFGSFVSKTRILNDWWRGIGPFFQKSLLLPMPAPEKVVSSSPLHTWEYDEIPWMEVKQRANNVFRGQGSAYSCGLCNGGRKWHDNICEGLARKNRTDDINR